MEFLWGLPAERGDRFESRRSACPQVFADLYSPRNMSRWRWHPAGRFVDVPPATPHVREVAHQRRDEPPRHLEAAWPSGPANDPSVHGHCGRCGRLRVFPRIASRCRALRFAVAPRTRQCTCGSHGLTPARRSLGPQHPFATALDGATVGSRDHVRLAQRQTFFGAIRRGARGISSALASCAGPSIGTTDRRSSKAMSINFGAPKSGVLKLEF
jgi:hypothetical protein